MGQQQLLLVILVTIIVGIATVVAINTFGSAADSANVDAVRQDVAQIAASAQGYYMKPAMLGGGSKTFNTPNITFSNLSFAAKGSSDTYAWNENGSYTLSAFAAGEFTVTAYPSSCDGYSEATTAATGSCTSTDDVLTATVLPDNMSWGS